MLGHPTLLVEFALVVIFLLTCCHAAQRGRRYLFEVISAAFYGLLLEEGDILIFGSYFYSDDFVLAIDRVPIAIALAWAIIIYSCMRLSDAYGLSNRIAPFADATWAIAMDFAFDAVAIRMGFWHWDIPDDAGWFGVPPGNFYAWLMVALSFSAVTRWLRWRGGAPAWQLATPPLIYAGLLLGFLPYVLLKMAFFPGDGNGLQVLVAAALTFAGVTLYGIVRNGWPRPQARELWPLLARLSFHFYFFGAIFAYRIYEDAPMLLVAAIGMLAFELLVTAPLYWPQGVFDRIMARWQQYIPALPLTRSDRELTIDARAEE